MSAPRRTFLAGFLGAVIGFVAGCVVTVSFNLLILGCNPHAAFMGPNEQMTKKTAEVIWRVGILLGPIVGALLAVRYARRPPANPS